MFLERPARTRPTGGSSKLRPTINLGLPLPAAAGPRRRLPSLPTGGRCRLPLPPGRPAGRAVTVKKDPGRSTLANVVELEQIVLEGIALLLSQENQVLDSYYRLGNV